MERQFYCGRISNVRVFTNYSGSEFHLFYVSICHDPSVFLDNREKKKRKKKIEKRLNQVPRGTSDATTSSSLIVPLFTMSVNYFSPS